MQPLCSPPEEKKLQIRRKKVANQKNIYVGKSDFAARIMTSSARNHLSVNVLVPFGGYMLGHPAGLGYLLVSVNWMVAPNSQRVGISSCKVAMVNP